MVNSIKGLGLKTAESRMADLEGPPVFSVCCRLQSLPHPAPYSVGKKERQI